MQKKKPLEMAAVEAESKEAAECQNKKTVDADRKFQVLDRWIWLLSKVIIRSSRVKGMIKSAAVAGGLSFLGGICSLAVRRRKGT